MKKLIPLLALFTILSSISIILLLSCAKEQPAPALPPLETAFYIWQQDWPDPKPGAEPGPVAQAVTIASPKADTLMYYAADLKISNGSLERQVMRVGLNTLADTGKPVVPVIRMNVTFAKLLKSGQADEVASILRDTILEMLGNAADYELKVSDIQLDYDCPTAGLTDYNKLIRLLNKELPDTKISITALPTWMNSPDFAALVKDLPYYVLQVHSIDIPKNIFEIPLICNTGKLDGWLEKAAAAKTPFHLALPTYGYDLIFDETGAYRGLLAEGASEYMEPGYKARRIMADPDSLAIAVTGLREKRPENCRGIVWFRLPVETDDLNWSWPALRAVMTGRPPIVVYEAEIRNPKTGLYEVWIKNTGEHNVFGELNFKLDTGKNRLLAYDIIGDFHENKAASTITGPAPKIGQPKIAGWFRFTDGTANNPAPLNITDIKVSK